MKMTVETITNSLIFIAGLLVALIGFTIRFSFVLGQVRLKIDTIWNLYIASANNEGVNKNFMQRNSPLVLTAKAIEAFDASGLGKELQEYYIREGHKFDDVRLLGEIEKRWGDRIAKEIAEPFHLHAGAEFIAAMKIAKQLKEDAA